MSNLATACSVQAGGDFCFTIAKQVKVLRKSYFLALSSLAGSADSTEESSRIALAKNSNLEFETVSVRTSFESERTGMSQRRKSFWLSAASL